MTVIFTRLVCIKSFSPSKEVARSPLGRPGTTGDFWLSIQLAGHSSTKPVKELETVQILAYLGLSRKQRKEREKAPGSVSLKGEQVGNRLIYLRKLMLHWEQNLHPPLELGFLQTMLLFISFNAGAGFPGQFKPKNVQLSVLMWVPVSWWQWSGFYLKLNFSAEHRDTSVIELHLTACSSRGEISHWRWVTASQPHQESVTLWS